MYEWSERFFENVRRWETHLVPGRLRAIVEWTEAMGFVYEVQTVHSYGECDVWSDRAPSLFAAQLAAIAAADAWLAPIVEMVRGDACPSCGMSQKLARV